MENLVITCEDEPSDNTSSIIPTYTASKNLSFFLSIATIANYFNP